MTLIIPPHTMPMPPQVLEAKQEEIRQALVKFIVSTLIPKQR